MSGDCGPSDEAIDIIRAMARAKLREGHTDTLDVIDSIHEAIGEHTELHKHEISDIIEGKTGKAPKEQSEIAQRMAKLKSELRTMRQAREKESGEAQAQKSAGRIKRINEQLAILQNRLDTGDFTPAPKRLKPEYGPEVKTKEIELERAREAVKAEMRRIEYQGQSGLYKAMSKVYNVAHAAILSGPTVVSHLIGASGWRTIATVLEDAVPVKAIAPRLSAKADLEGGGFMGMGNVEGLKAAFSKETLKAVKDKIVRGASDRQILYGKDHQGSHAPLTFFAEARAKHDVLNYPLLGIVGKIHDAIKTPVENYAFARATYRISKNMQRNLEAMGKSPKEIEMTMVSDSSIAMVSAKAYEASQAAKLQGKNTVVDRYNQMLREMDRSGDIGAVAAAFMRMETPIVKIPSNYAAEAASYIGGAAKAVSASRRATREVRASQAYKTMSAAERAEAKLGAISPETADYILRNIKKQTVGAGLLALGYFGHAAFGGLYRDQKKQPNPNVPIGDIKVGEHEIGHGWLHSPFTGVMQAGALIYDAQHEDMKKGGKPLESALDGFGQATMALLLDVPVFNIPKDLVKLSRGGQSAGKFLGEKVAMVAEPGALQYWARSRDVDKAGNPIKRKPRGFADQLRMGIPGLREQVPRK